MLLRAGAVWILLLTIAIANGALRETFLTPAFGEIAGHILSTAILCVTIFVVTRLSLAWIGPKSRHHAVTIGIQWMLLTIAFEFLAGRYVFGITWERLFADYNLIRGRVWVLVLFADLLSPILVFRRLRSI
jgi:hypothetical protein